MIPFDTFAATELKIGTIREAERIEGSTKLLKLAVDLGEPTLRTICAGIGLSYAPETLISTQVTVVANLEPRKLMGIESQGMVLATHAEDGSLSLVRPEKQTAPGSSVS